MFVQYDAVHDFSVWLRTISNPVDINRFRRFTGIIFFQTFSNKSTKEILINKKIITISA